MSNVIFSLKELEPQRPLLTLSKFSFFFLISQMSTHYTMTSGELECSSMRKFLIGEQVSICYGDRPNFELLIHNGFVIEDHVTDFIRIPLGEWLFFFLTLKFLILLVVVNLSIFIVTSDNFFVFILVNKYYFKYVYDK